MTTNEIAKIQLFRIAATMPWAEVETTQQHVRLTYYDGAQEGDRDVCRHRGTGKALHPPHRRLREVR